MFNLFYLTFSNLNEDILRITCVIHLLSLIPGNEWYKEVREKIYFIRSSSSYEGKFDWIVAKQFFKTSVLIILKFEKSW